MSTRLKASLFTQMPMPSYGSQAVVLAQTILKASAYAPVEHTLKKMR